MRNAKLRMRNVIIPNSTIRLPNLTMGGYQSGQMGRTVNPLLRLRRFESFSPHTQPVDGFLNKEIKKLVLGF